MRSGGANIPVPVAEVSWFEARGDYVAAHAGPLRHMVRLSLNRLQERLDPKRFLRIHRTHIVNLDRVKRFRPHGKCRLEAILADGICLPVSKNRSQELRGLGT